jgi:hypothetical protein
MTSPTSFVSFFKARRFLVPDIIRGTSAATTV